MNGAGEAWKSRIEMYKEISFNQSPLPAYRPNRQGEIPGRLSSHPLQRLGRHILATARRMLAAHNERLRVRRDEQQLRDMPKYRLRDMGLERLPNGKFARIAGGSLLKQPAHFGPQTKLDFKTDSNPVEPRQ